VRNVALGYFGHSRLVWAAGKALLNLEPNLLRDPVAFDAPLRHPVRFREAVSALHDVVVSDLRFKKRDKAAYLEWKKAETQRLAQVRRDAHREALAEIQRKRADVPAELEAFHEKRRVRYWGARLAYANFLRRHDPVAWRALMPCDPVITVAPDVVFFECFSADESSYGCLSVTRGEGFGEATGVRHGTTNVDYSWDLYDHFQGLRSYRETRFRLDPAGFEVATAGAPEYREEKIELPPGWLRGFLRMQSAMALPATRVTLTRDAVYSLLVWLRRHRARTSPRALRFELSPGRAPVIAIEPWDTKITCHGSVYEGPPTAPIRVWGRQRLLTLARLLPLVERFDVFLLGTGLPSFWLARMGEMRLTLGLSGWTTNDWTRASALDLLHPPAAVTPALVDRVGELLRRHQKATLAEVERETGAATADARAALDRLALTGQVIHDLAEGVYRWRQVMPIALGEEQIGPPDPEVVGARELVAHRGIALVARQPAPGGEVLTGRHGDLTVEVLVDPDGRIRRGQCACFHHRKAGLRRGPCRHLLSLRLIAWDDGRDPSRR